MRLHENTTFDPDAEATALVSKLEGEALDEVQVIDALNVAMETLASRRAAAVERVNAEVNGRFEDRRREHLKAGIKGVKPIVPTPPPGLVEVPGGVIPNLRAVR